MGVPAAAAAGAATTACGLRPARRSHRLGPAGLLAAALLAPVSDAAALVFTIGPSTRTVYLQVGAGTVSTASCWLVLRCPTAGRNTTINTVSVTVPAVQLGNGVPQAMTTNSTTSASPFNGNIVCTAQQQLYVAAYLQESLFRNSGPATLRVTTPATLTNGSNTLPFTQISWTRSSGTTATDIPAGTFSGGTQDLLSIARNTWVENCLSFSYANSAVVAAGTYTGRATFALTVL